jgi:hypothetical protein
MIKRRLRRPSPALVISIVALIAALGGTSYAAFTLPKNSVGTKQLKKNAVTTKKIKNGAVTAKKINPAGLTVPNALHANHADTAGTAGHASTADSATHASSTDVANGLGTLPSGRSESGVWVATSGSESGADWATDSINFPVPLASSLNSTHTVFVPGASATHCSGPGHADPGFLCVYVGESANVTFYGILNPGGGGTSTGFGADPTGAAIYFTATAAGNYADGQWTVTAP